MDIIESTWASVPIDTAGADALMQLGTHLVARESWWGSGRSDEEDDPEGEDTRTAIRCRLGATGSWEIRVADRVGVISVGSLQIRVMPKIPHDHAMYILGLLPAFGDALRSADSRIDSQVGGGFWEVVAHSFVWTAERLLRSELSPDYLEIQDELPYVRGKIRTLDTARNLMKGRLMMAVEFDEFDLDTPLNRVIRAGSRIVANNRLVDDVLRRRALRIVARTEGIGDLGDGDLRVVGLDRRTAHYREPYELARLLLAEQATTLSVDGVPARAYLLRMPDLVERALRRVLNQVLSPQWPVYKHPVTLTSPQGETINPDLLIGRPTRLVGDVKYKVGGTKWLRPDVYEVATFAIQCRSEDAAVVDFSQTRELRPDFVVGDVRIKHLPWFLDVAPEEAVRELGTQFQTWIDGATSDVLVSELDGLPPMDEDSRSR